MTDRPHWRELSGELPEPLPPPPLPSGPTPETDGEGSYWLDRRGHWRYALGGGRVPGARPKTAWDAAYNYPTLVVRAARYRAVPEWDLPLAGPELRALLQNPACLEQVVYVPQRANSGRMTTRAVRHRLVPVGLWPRPEACETVPGLWAPELDMDRLVHTAQLAQIMGYTRIESVQSGGLRGRVPRPVLRTRKVPAPSVWWSRPIIELWRAGWREYRYEMPAQLRARREAQGQ